MASDGFPYPVDLPGNFSVADRPKPVEHKSDCAVHNEPALPAGPCNCGGLPISEADHMAEALGRITMLRAFQGARRLAKRKRDPNWVFAMEMFGLGSTYAWGMCKRLGIDPDGFSADPLP